MANSPSEHGNSFEEQMEGIPDLPPVSLEDEGLEDALGLGGSDERNDDTGDEYNSEPNTSDNLEDELEDELEDKDIDTEEDVDDIDDDVEEIVVRKKGKGKHTKADKKRKTGKVTCLRSCSS